MRTLDVVLVAVTALTLAGCGGDDIPYTSQQMTQADLECDAEVLGDALVGTTTTSEQHTDCLQRKLPDLSNRQITHLADTIEAARDQERQG